MNNAVKGSASHTGSRIRVILLLLAILTSPVFCCGGMQLLDSVPSSWLPPSLDFMINLFEGSVRVENKTPRVLYITAITTIYGAPRIISQNMTFRQRNIPIGSQSSITLQYDSADFPLSGIIVCRGAEDCRLLPANSSGVYQLNSYESLDVLEPGWLDVIQTYPSYNYGAIVIAASSFVPILLFSSWLYLTRREKKKQATDK